MARARARARAIGTRARASGHRWCPSPSPSHSSIIAKQLPLACTISTEGSFVIQEPSHRITGTDPDSVYRDLVSMLESVGCLGNSQPLTPRWASQPSKQASKPRPQRLMGTSRLWSLADHNLSC